MRLHRFKSRQRMTMRLGIALLVLLCVAAWMTAQAVQRELRDTIDDQLRTDASDVTSVLEMLGEDVVVAIRDHFVRDAGDITSAEVAIILRVPDGEVVTMGVDLDRPATVPDVVDTPIAELRGQAGEPFTVDAADGDDDAYRVMSVALENGSVAVVARSLDGVEAVLRILHKTFLFGTVISVLALAGLVWMISRQVLKPLEDVVDTAHAIGAGNLDTRVDVGSTAPDVERLSDAMNKMLERLQTAFDRQERSEARLREFVADASHELRTPLAAILGHAELYHEEMARTPEQVDAAMRHITTEGTRMQSLVEDLLLLARLDEGRPLAADAVDLSGIVADSVAAMSALDGDHHLVVDAEPVHVVGDDRALRQVVDNLLINVVVHTPPGTTATVELRPARGTNGDASGARLVISDDGPGIPPAIADHVFERFVRAESSRARTEGSLGGSGLGLSIVAELVRAQGGTVSVASTPGGGATFTVILPTDDDMADLPD